MGLGSSGSVPKCGDDSMSILQRESDIYRVFIAIEPIEVIAESEKRRYVVS